MNKIAVIGGGFAGLGVVNRLSKSGLALEIILIDKKDTMDFLPLLPDCIGRGINPGFLTFNIENIAKKLKLKFIKDEVISVELEKKQLVTKRESVYYDYLVIASGSETNFYANQNIRENTFKLDDVDDVKKLTHRLKQEKIDNFIIAGGGYTGIELAGSLRGLLDKMQRQANIIIVERAPHILGPLPDWMKDHVLGNLKKLRVDVYTNTTVQKIVGESVYLSGGIILERSLVIWVAGVKTAGFIQNLKIEKNPQGRIKVDEYLRLNASCFVAGDAALFAYKGNFLRMAVQFAITQGQTVAQNIVNSITGKRLNKFTPLDFGYIIPLVNNNSCGRVLGLNLKGILPTILHFIMCIYRSWGMRNKLGITNNLLRLRHINMRGTF